MRKVKIQIRKRADINLFEGDIDEIISRLNEIKKENKECENISIDVYQAYLPYDEDETMMCDIIGFRKENKEEIESRKLKEKKSAEKKLAAAKRLKELKIIKEKKKEEKDLAEYERLKKKFE